MAAQDQQSLPSKDSVSQRSTANTLTDRDSSPWHLLVIGDGYVGSTLSTIAAVGRLFFGVSLGPEPWALALPTPASWRPAPPSASWSPGSRKARGRPAARIDRHPQHGRRGRLLVGDRPRAALDAVRDACLSHLLGNGRLQRLSDPPPDGERRDHADARAPRLRRHLPHRRPRALPPSLTIADKHHAISRRCVPSWSALSLD
jgi:hypothetical protein